MCAEAVSDPTTGNYEDQRRTGLGHRCGAGSNPFCLRRYGKPSELCGFGGFCFIHEYVFLHPLSHRLLSAPALHGGDGDEKRHLPNRHDLDLCGVLRHDEPAFANFGVRRSVYCLLRVVLRSCQYFGLQICAADFPATDIRIPSTEQVSFVGSVLYKINFSCISEKASCIADRVPRIGNEKIAMNDHILIRADNSSPVGNIPLCVGISAEL